MNRYGYGQVPGMVPIKKKEPLNAQVFRTQRPESPEDLSQPLYDRVNYPAAGVGQLSFFSSPIGTSVTLIRAGATGTFAKTKRDTNLETQNVAPAKMFKLVGVSVAYIPVQQAIGTANTGSIGDDIMRLKYGAAFEFLIGDKRILDLPVHIIPESNPIQSVSTTITASSMISSGTVQGIPMPMYKFNIPVTVNPYESFRANFVFDGTVTLVQTMDVQLIFHAFMRRPG